MQLDQAADESEADAEPTMALRQTVNLQLSMALRQAVNLQLSMALRQAVNLQLSMALRQAVSPRWRRQAGGWRCSVSAPAPVCGEQDQAPTALTGAATPLFSFHDGR